MNINMKAQGQGSQPRPKINAQSSLLTPEENETVFKMLGRKCQTLNTAVVQIYKTEGSAHSHWKKKHTGVVCFVKDSAIRSYFLRAYCLIKNELIWEHEIYDGMKITKARSFLVTFEGQDGHIGLNFVSEDECDSFFRAVNSTIENRSRKKIEKRNRPKSQNAPIAPPNIKANTTTTFAPTMTDSSVQLRNHPNFANAAPTPKPATKKFFSSSSASNKDKKPKIIKSDISNPTNFVHLHHIGWDDVKGFDKENEEMLQPFLKKAGVSESELNDRDTLAFIYNFIQSNNVLASVQSEREDSSQAVTPAPAPPPVPSRHHHSQNGNTSQRTAPPPPPARQPPPPVPTTVPGAARQPAPPTRPPPINVPLPPPPPPLAPPISNATTVPAPPPPPPPPAAMPPPPSSIPATVLPTITTTDAPNETKAPSSLPVVNDSHSALMESIRKGTNLKKVDTSAHSTGSGDSRSDLMSEIRMGIELRPAQNRELGANRSSDDGAGTDALADALRRALQERGRVIQSSDEDSESSGNDDEWDD